VHPSNLEGYAGDGGAGHYQAMGKVDMVKVLEDWETNN
jgi:hypothetical protein